MNAELDNLSVDDATQTEEKIVSQWRYISADEKHQMRQQVDQILRPLGLETRLLVVNQISSLAVFFNCTSQRAVRSLRVHWNSGQLSDIIEALFTLLSGVTVRIRKLTWPAAGSAPARPATVPAQHTKVATRPKTAPTPPSLDPLSISALA